MVYGSLEKKGGDLDENSSMLLKTYGGKMSEDRLSTMLMKKVAYSRLSTICMKTKGLIEIVGNWI
jgi:hypothetical protein